MSCNFKFDRISLLEALEEGLVRGGIKIIPLEDAVSCTHLPTSYGSYSNSLLKSTNMSVKEVSRLLGFQSVSSLLAELKLRDLSCVCDVLLTFSDDIDFMIGVVGQKYSITIVGCRRG